MQTLLVSLVLAFSAQQQLEGGEVADGPVHSTFGPGGKYSVVKHDKAAGDTRADGKWTATGDSVEVKVASCKGPACKGFEAGFKADLVMVGERAMTVKSTPADAALGSGAYYCRYQGCARRIGVMVAGHDAQPLAMRFLVDFLIDKNRGRDTKTHADRALAGSSWVEPSDDDKPAEQTVVWEGEKAADKLLAPTLTYCTRNEAVGKKAADQLAKDLAELPWVGRPVAKASADAACLWDVRLLVGDDVKVPARK